MRKKQKTKPTSNLHTLYIMLCCNVGWLIIGFTCARIVKIYIIYSNIYHHPLLSILNDPQTCYHLRVRVYIIYYTLSHTHTPSYLARWYIYNLETPSKKRKEVVPKPKITMMGKKREMREKMVDLHYVTSSSIWLGRVIKSNTTAIRHTSGYTSYTNTNSR